MTKQLTTKFLSLLVVLCLCACAMTRPITNLNNEPVPAGLSAEQVATDIIAGAEARGWYANMAEPGVIDAKLHTRGHDVTIKINYTNKNYSTKYVSSKNMHASDGKIHYKYSRWMTMLNRAIHVKLSQHRDHANH